MTNQSSKTLHKNNLDMALFITIHMQEIIMQFMSSKLAITLNRDLKGILDSMIGFVMSGKW
jgi:hypothetical protein